MTVAWESRGSPLDSERWGGTQVNRVLIKTEKKYKTNYKWQLGVVCQSPWWVSIHGGPRWYINLKK